jgi:serine/threonine protein phosphatase 1
MKYKYIYAIGDVHGCRKELQQALDWIEKDAGDEKDNQIVMIGDYIDRGPDSSGVLATVFWYKIWLGDRFVALMGNHEDMALNDYSNWLYNGGRECLASYIDGEMTDEHRRFLKTLPKYYETENHIFVHAGIDDEVPMDQQFEGNLLWKRYRGGEGPEKIKKLMVHGHTPQKELEYGPNRMNIDTACVFGGKLTVAKFDASKREAIDIYQVERK